MIKHSTVLVLGAGASKPYGFQTGYELRDQLLEETLASTPLNEALKASQLGEQAEEFIIDLRHSSRSSVDAFLEGRPDYLEIGKFLIAAAVLPRERKPLFPTTEDWCGFFLT